MTENNTIRDKAELDAHGTAALNVPANPRAAFDQGWIAVSFAQTLVSMWA